MIAFSQRLKIYAAIPYKATRGEWDTWIFGDMSFRVLEDQRTVSLVLIFEMDTPGIVGIASIERLNRNSFELGVLEVFNNTIACGKVELSGHSSFFHKGCRIGAVT